ncbi:MAG: hypothetical protein RR483_06130, partial [Clostridia bacterium]
MKKRCILKSRLINVSIKRTIACFLSLMFFAIASFSCLVFSEDASSVQEENIVNIKIEDLISTMDTDIINAAGDIACILTVDGKIKAFFKDYYSKEISSENYTSDQSTQSSDTSSDSVTSEENILSNALKKNGVIKFNSFGDYKNKRLAENSINQIKNAIYEFKDVIGIKNSAGTIIALDNNSSIIHFDFTSGYLEENSPYIFNPSENLGKKPLKITTSDNYFAVLYEDGTVSTTVSDNSGYSKELEETSQWVDIKKISTGENHIVGIKKDGSVVAAGINNYGQKDIGSYSNVANVATSLNHTVLLLSNGTVKATGNNNNGQCDVSGFDNIVAIDTSETGTVGLKCNGTVVYTGAGEQIKRDVTFWENIVAVKAGKNFVIGITDEGKIVLSQQDIENPLIIDENVSVNTNDAKYLKDTRIKIKSAYDKNSSNIEYRLQQEKINERNKQ